MLVEFVGPSCGGKSTLIRRAQAELSQAGIPCSIANGRRGPRPRASAVLNPHLVTWGILNPRVVMRREGRILLRSAGVAVELAHDRTLVLLDEGPLKARQRQYVRELQRGERLLDSALPVPDLLVWVSCVVPERLYRLRTARPEARAWTEDELTVADGEKYGAVFRFAKTREVPLWRVDTSDGSLQPARFLEDLQLWCREQDNWAGTD
jgi:hypothetical protein